MCALRALVLRAAAVGAAATRTSTVAIKNERASDVYCHLPTTLLPPTIHVGEAIVVAGVEVPATIRCGEDEAVVDGGGYAVVTVADDALRVDDANAFQLELNRAAHVCEAADPEGASFGPTAFVDCVYGEAFGGGVRRDDAPNAWPDLWRDTDYWRLCEPSAPSPALRSFEAAAAPGVFVDVLRETPFVALARGFVSGDECDDVARTTPAVRNLARARVGGGAGSTSFSDARETLSTNLFVDWDDAERPLTLVAARTVELASELIGETIPYEAQEPVNFLHYRSGYEYKPHSDGGGRKVGARFATTLVYCDAADAGGATVFPVPPTLKFSPKRGDLLFFEYKNGRRGTTHAACPVTGGNKTTLTMWHRLGVTPEKPWDEYENWGKFAHPFLASRYRGPTHRERVLADRRRREL